jgi:hypothetical protein
MEDLDNAGFPPAFRAAEIALMSLKQNRSGTWHDMLKAGTDPRLTEEQRALVDSEMAVVSQLQLKFPPSNLQPVSVTCCPKCFRISFIGGAGPTKCALTHSCDGIPVRAGAIKRAPKAAAAETVIPPTLEPAVETAF